VSPDVLTAQGSVLAYKYAEGYPDRRTPSKAWSRHCFRLDRLPYGSGRPPAEGKGWQAEHALERAVACNKKAILFDPEKPAVSSGIRLGSSAGTTRVSAKSSSGRSAS
jgi:glycine/serine hydroxymethyltransferase